MKYKLKIIVLLCLGFLLLAPSNQVLASGIPIPVGTSCSSTKGQIDANIDPSSIEGTDAAATTTINFSIDTIDAEGDTFIPGQDYTLVANPKLVDPITNQIQGDDGDPATMIFDVTATDKQKITIPLTYSSAQLKIGLWNFELHEKPPGLGHVIDPPTLNGWKIICSGEFLMEQPGGGYPTLTYRTGGASIPLTSDLNFNLLNSNSKNQYDFWVIGEEPMGYGCLYKVDHLLWIFPPANVLCTITPISPPSPLSGQDNTIIQQTIPTTATVKKDLNDNHLNQQTRIWLCADLHSSAETDTRKKCRISLSYTFDPNASNGLFNKIGSISGAGYGCIYGYSIGSIIIRNGPDPKTGMPSNKTGVASAIGCIPTSPDDLIITIVLFSLAIGGGIAFLLMVFGGFEMIMSAGNPEALQNGQERFQNAIIGLLFIIFSILLLQIIANNVLGLPGI